MNVTLRHFARCLLSHRSFRRSTTHWSHDLRLYALFIILQEVKREVNEGNENGEYWLFSFGSINKNGRYIFDDIFQLSESTTVHHHYGYENAAWGDRDHKSEVGRIAVSFYGLWIYASHREFRGASLLHIGIKGGHENEFYVRRACKLAAGCIHTIFHGRWKYAEFDDPA